MHLSALPRTLEPRVKGQAIPGCLTARPWLPHPLGWMWACEEVEVWVNWWAEAWFSGEAPLEILGTHLMASKDLR